MSATRRATPRVDVDDQTRSASASADVESIHSNITVDGLVSHATDTPPTSQADSASVSSTPGDAKLDDLVVTAAALTDAPAILADDDTTIVLATVVDKPTPMSPPAPIERARRARTSVSSYNLKVLSGTAVHVPRKFRKDLPSTEDEPAASPVRTRRQTLSGGAGGSLRSASRSAADALSTTRDTPTPKTARGPRRTKSMGALSESPKKLSQAEMAAPESRRPARFSTANTLLLADKFNAQGKRTRKAFEEGVTKTKRELRNLMDTFEFAHIDTRPVLHEVWSNGKLVVEGAEPPKKRTRKQGAKEKAEEEAAAAAEAEAKRKAKARKEKLWLAKGLYAGQEIRSEKVSLYDDLKLSNRYNLPQFKPDGILPLPMWHGERLIHGGRDFKLPYDICAPLPPGQPKPDEWRKTTKNRFVGDAAELWKKKPMYDDFSSRCVCGPKGGCDEDCQNRIMLYECDDQNCSAGRDHCQNRAFADLQERRKLGGVYRIGVEVIKTADRGYGVRSNRSFKANQIIVEYTGEIITEEECDRRMNEDYKDNDCYYLMSFDQNMIIDATRGSIARFVNHSCQPNCRMVKWVVAGQPRMALFAGDRDIMTGEELTYDYNFNPFSQKNVQKCLCGSSNCRGVLGPRPKEPVKPKLLDAAKRAVGRGKRKFKEIVGDDGKPVKKRKYTKSATVAVKGKPGPKPKGKPGPKPKGKPGPKPKGKPGPKPKGLKGSAITGRKVITKSTTKTTTVKAKAKASSMVKLKSKSVKVLKTYGKGTSGWKSIAKPTTSVKRVRKASAKAVAGAGTAPKANGLKRVSADLARSLRRQK